MNTVFRPRRSVIAIFLLVFFLVVAPFDSLAFAGQARAAQTSGRTAGASSLPTKPSTTSSRPHGTPPSANLQKEEGDWFQLSHFGSSRPTPTARITALATARELPKGQDSLPWTPLGPQPINNHSLWGLVSGRITAEAVNPTNRKDLWVGAADGGLWHSTNGGAAWTAMTDSQPTLSIGSIAIDPTNANTIYVGTGEANSNGDSYWGIGILKSTDGGATWTNYGLNDFGGLGIGKIAVDPANSQILLLSAIVDLSGDPSGPPDPSQNAGIWQSNNGGVTWNQVLSNTAGTDVVFDPASPTIAFAGLAGYMSGYGSSTSAGVYKSTDAGATWNRIEVAPLPFGNTVGRVSLGVSKSGKQVYAVITDSNGNLLNSKIYSSPDGGATWQGEAVPAEMANDSGESIWWYDSYVAVDPSVKTGKTAYVGGVDIWQTSDGGKNWKNLTNANNQGAVVHPDQHALVFFGNTSSFYLGNDGGVWSGTFPGGTLTFTNLNAGGLNITQFYGGSIGEAGTNAQLYGGAQDNGEDQYPVGSIGVVTWNQVYAGDGGNTAVDYTNNAVVYEEGIYATINQSTNGGTSWSACISDLNADKKNTNFIAPLIISPNNHDELFLEYIIMPLSLIVWPVEAIREVVSHLHLSSIPSRASFWPAALQ